MKAVRTFFILLISFNVSAQKKQLLYIEEADRSGYVDKSSKRIVYPKFHLSITNDDSVFVHNKLIYSKSLISIEDSSVFFEIYNSNILVISSLENSKRGINDPMLVKRKSMYFITLKSPNKILYGNFLNRRIVSNKSVLNYLKKSKELFYLISNINFYRQTIALENTDNQIETLNLSMK